jgi:protocatechuate 3,4-dioxygenase beta subunit
MAWQTYFLSWLAHAALSAFLLLAAGCLAVRLCRQPVRRLRWAELTLLGCLLTPWLGLVPGLPRYELGWLETVKMETAPPAPEIGESVPVGLAEPPHLAPSLDEKGERPVSAALSKSTQPADDQPISTAVSEPHQPASAGRSPGLLLVYVYLGLTTTFVLWWLIGVGRLWQLCLSARPAPTMAVELLERIAGPAGRQVRLWVSDRLELPIMFGWRRPVIILPDALCREGDRAALRYCLAHEWSHVERRDIAGWHLATVIQFLFFYQPLFWWLRRQLRLCQDYLADARAAEQAILAEDYADYLVGLARRRLGAPVPAALGIGDRRSNLYRRILMLLTTHQPLERRCRRLWTAAAALTTLVLLVAVAAVRLDASSADDKKEPTRDVPKEAAKGKPIPYTGRVFDKVTNKGIEGATVTVRRSIYGDHIGNKIVEESKHKTNAEGKYNFVIPPEQAAERYLYIELDVEAPGYAPRKHFGYSFAMIQKNEKMGGRAFFENVDMRAAKEITGRIETPDGKPAAGIKVMAYSNADKQDGFEYGSFADCKTDAEGRFRLWLVTPGPAVFWLLPEKYAPSTHVIQDSNKRGDMGRFTLEPGLILKGKVLDTQGNPAVRVFVEADKRGGIENFNLPVADHIRRTAVTNDKGEFTMAPLPPGQYEIMPQEHGYDPSKDEQRPEKRPLPGVFVRKSLTLKAGEEPEPLEIRAVPHVVIEAQYYNSKGKTTRGHAGHLFGQVDKGSYWFGQAKIDTNGKMTLLAPHGLTQARLSLMTNEHGVLRHRLKKDQPLSTAREIDLGTLNDDVKGIEIIHYIAPILIVDARDKDGKQVKDFQVKVTYPPGVGKKRPGESFVNGVQGDVYMEKQEDGRWRTSQMLPDEEVEVTVSAKGYKSHTEKLKLAEGTSKDLAPVLEKE